MAGTRPLSRELLIQLIVVAIVPIVVTLAFFVWQLFPQLKQNLVEEQQSIASLVALQTRQRIDTAAEQAHFFLELATQNLGEINRIVPGFVRQSSFFDSLYVLDEDSLILAIGIRGANQETTEELYLGTDLSRSSLLADRVTNTQKYWTGVFLSVVTGRLSIAYVMPLRGRTLVAELAIDRLPKLSQALQKQGIVVMILDGNYQLIAHPDPEFGQRQINLSNLGAFQHDPDISVYSTTFDLLNKLYFGTHVAMSYPNWHIIVAEEEYTSNSALIRSLLNWFLSMGGILLLALIFSSGRARAFSKRFQYLNQQANEITQGQYLPAKYDPHISELKELSDNLIKMAEAIERREQSLQTKEMQLRKTLESAPTIAIQWYDQSGKVQYWNAASEHIFGIKREQAEGQDLGDMILNEKELARFREQFQLLKNGKGGRQEFELNYSAKSGIDGQVKAILFEIPVQAGEERYACMMTDITQQRKAEASILMLNSELEHRVDARTRELKVANSELKTTLDVLNNTMEQLVQSEKLASLGSLVAGVAHELNTPIGNARMASSTLHDFSKEITLQLKDGSIKKSTLERFLDDALSATGITSRNLERASELIASFKQVAADQSSSNKRHFKLNDLVHEILMTLHPQTKKKPIDIQVDIEQDIEMNSFPGPLGQVLSNLVLNAEIHGYEETQSGTITIEGKKEGGMLTLRVADDGCGIDEAYLTKVFDPFFTTKLGQGGSGLGLHIVHNIVSEVLAGHIEVDSEAGKGTRFSIMIPVEAPLTSI